MINNIAALTIAGSDPGAGAGIQADLKTFSALDVYGTTVITAITAQNRRGVTAIQPVDDRVVEQQLTAVLEVFPIKAIKTGMLYSASIIRAVAAGLRRFPSRPLVIDPVLTATVGRQLLQEEATGVLQEELFPLAALVTPNIAEAETLCGLEQRIETLSDLEDAAEKCFKKFSIPVLLKGGHLADSACDVLYDTGGIKRFPGELVGGVDNHGSGCTLSAAITAFLARGFELHEAIAKSKTYIVNTLVYPHRLTQDTQVMNHFPPAIEQDKDFMI